MTEFLQDKLLQKLYVFVRLEMSLMIKLIGKDYIKIRYFGTIYEHACVRLNYWYVEVKIIVDIPFCNCWIAFFFYFHIFFKKN